MLMEMLRYRRPAGSNSERAFIKRYIDSVPGMTHDAFGNRFHLNTESKTIISVHTDTVHRMGGMQKIVGVAGIIGLHERELVSNCLGADDTAGIYAALRMIEAKVPVSFIFHREEEIGGRGSRWLAKHHSGWLSTFERCIALDRRGSGDVITHQSGERCCSEVFAQALAGVLDMGHKPEHGIFTDSANYTELIPECSNLSVGYAREHSHLETLDVEYLERLIVRLCAIDWNALPTKRDPRAIPEVEGLDLPWWMDAQDLENMKEEELYGHLDDEEVARENLLYWGRRRSGY